MVKRYASNKTKRENITQQTCIFYKLTAQFMFAYLLLSHANYSKNKLIIHIQLGIVVTVM